MLFHAYPSLSCLFPNHNLAIATEERIQTKTMKTKDTLYRVKVVAFWCIEKKKEEKEMHHS